MRVLITGGGTGGHLMPAMAVGAELTRIRPDTELLFVGTTVGLDDQILSGSGFKYELLKVRGLRGKSLAARLRAAFDFATAFMQARRIIKDLKPNLVVGVGGYASAAASMAAIVARMPLILLEQNTRPGLANRLLARFARRICVAFEESAAYFAGASVIVTGNPIRFHIDPQGRLQTDHRSMQILVLGGSSGAHRLNIGVLKAFKNLGKTVINLRVLHQTGAADEGLVRSGYAELGMEAAVTAFVDDIGPAYQNADLIVARAGANTVSEVALAGRPAVFVPYPFHRDHQQEHNARVIEKLGGAIIIKDDESLGDNLASVLQELIGDRPRLREMGERARAAAKPDAAERIARVCFEVAGVEAGP